MHPPDKSEVEGSASRVLVAEDNPPGFLVEGSRFGAYRVGACIGRGGMACIYRAEHLGLRRQVALKVLMGEVAAGAESHARFLREARIAAGIKHPSVVDIYDVGVHEDVPFLVMELLVGQDLEAYLTASGVPDESTLIELMIPVVAGLAAVHDAGVVHRDLKPGNIFLTQRGDGSFEPRLLDFGISRSFWRNEPRLTAVRQGVLIGTPLYMSPEAMQGREITPLSDQYSLGVVLYECASGVNPFVANNIAEIVRRVTTGDFAPLGSQPTRPSKRLADIIARAMSVDPEQRFPDMRAFGRELMALSGVRTRLTWGRTFGGELGGVALVRHDEYSEQPAEPAAAPPGSSRERRAMRIVALGAAAVIGGAGFAGAQKLFAGPRHAPAAYGESAAGAAATGATAPRSEVAALRPGNGEPGAAAATGSDPVLPVLPFPGSAHRTEGDRTEVDRPQVNRAEAARAEGAAWEAARGEAARAEAGAAAGSEGGRSAAPSTRRGSAAGAGTSASAASQESRRGPATGRAAAGSGRRSGSVKAARRPSAAAKRRTEEQEQEQPDWLPTEPVQTAPAAEPEWLIPSVPRAPRGAGERVDQETGTNDALILD